MIREVNAEVKVAKAIAPELRSAGTATGVTIDRSGFESAQWVLYRGDDTGSPDNFSLAVHIEESPDNSTWTNVEDATDADGVAAQSVFTTCTQDSDVDMIATMSMSLRNRMKYVRAVGVLSFTNGTSPKLAYAVLCNLGKAYELPVTQVAYD